MQPPAAEADRDLPHPTRPARRSEAVHAVPLLSRAFRACTAWPGGATQARVLEDAYAVFNSRLLSCERLVYRVSNSGAGAGVEALDRRMARLGTALAGLQAAIGAALGVPVFAGDWLMGALSRFGMRHRRDLGAIGDELLATLAYRQLSAGGSAVLDATNEDPATRTRWATLATAVGAAYVPVLCICTNPDLHRTRVEHRIRRIPGWADAADWADTRTRIAAFTPWPDAPILDTATSGNLPPHRPQPNPPQLTTITPPPAPPSNSRAASAAGRGMTGVLWLSRSLGLCDRHGWRMGRL
jgi:predicted kinase